MYTIPKIFFLPNGIQKCILKRKIIISYNVWQQHYEKKLTSQLYSYVATQSLLCYVGQLSRKFTLRRQLLHVQHSYAHTPNEGGICVRVALCVLAMHFICHYNKPFSSTQLPLNALRRAVCADPPKTCLCFTRNSYFGQRVKALRL